MKKFSLVFLGSLVVLAVIAAAGIHFLSGREAAYQADAGKKRVADVYKIATLLEECKTKQGTYPLVKELREPGEKGYTQVIQAIMLSQPDQDWVNQPFPFNMNIPRHNGSKLAKALNQCLGRDDVRVPVDPQHRPYIRPNTYIVLFTSDDSYTIIAFLDTANPYTSRLAENVYAFAISSDLGPTAENVTSKMHIKPQIFKDIPQDEISNALAEGQKIDDMFSNWATISISESE